MPKRMTVGAVRKAMENLPDDAPFFVHLIDPQGCLKASGIPAAVPTHAGPEQLWPEQAKALELTHRYSFGLTVAAMPYMA